MAENYTKQHIVPKRYLNRFGTKSGDRTIIGTYIVNKGKAQLFIESTENVGYLKNFYDATDKSDPKYWEHFLAREIDSLCGQDMDNIIAKVMLSQNNEIVLTEHDKKILAKVIVSQMTRVPDSVEYVTSQLYPKASQQIKEDIAATLPQFMLGQYGERLKNIELSTQSQKELLLNHAFAPENFERYCEVLQKGIWVVYINVHRDATPFLTSDNPVLVEGVGSKKIGLFHNGLANPATCIFFPLTPAIAVSIYSSLGFLGIVANEYDGKKVLLDDIKYIVSKNVKIMGQAYRHSFVPQPLYDELRSYLQQ